MKTILLLIVLAIISSRSFAQKKQPGFAVIKASAIKFNDADPLLAGSAVFGRVVHKKLGLGLGAELMVLQGDGRPYIPLFLEASYLHHKKRPSPYLNLRAGFGIYRSNITVPGAKVSTNGGLYLSPGAGIYFPVKTSNGIILSLSYVHSGFTTEVLGRKSSSSMDGGALSVGFRF